ncbi:hypothetical protein [Acerihabitans arboris]|uniref:Aminoglycoside phosphotransferase domain-containing protein n=1 Tax=Acerihabitans arboris TaxID=2691583 RepID=A0A845SG90_9GAMM|nr:hypothetical protein [Acerihabitans arboris]NDL61641.1 hypothetical protein [Acerihabitans arboris]
MSKDLKAPYAAQARAMAKAGDWAGAGDRLGRLIADITATPVLGLKINRDRYSLNSLNGQVMLADHRTLFFKYHHEDGEDQTIEEYYRAGLLRDAGFRVDVPLYACGEPGRQILLYALRNDKRLAEVCHDIEDRRDWRNMDEVVGAQQRADRALWTCCQPTLVPGSRESVVKEPIHQLFYHRLVSAGEPVGLGGRVKQFYVGKTFQLAQAQIPWRELSRLQWEINGVVYPHTLEQLFLEAGERLEPAALAGHGAITAHGDAHNANVWFDTRGRQPELVSFDPAFAGSAIPALLAEIKATFHNIFAHPCWLYEPGQAARYYRVAVIRDGDRLKVTHNWQLTPLRRAFLDSKGTGYWQPLLAELKRRGWLPAQWQRIVRLAMFCCPTLVLDLRAGGNSGHTPVSSALGLALAVMLGSGGEDDFTRWLNALAAEA